MHPTRLSICALLLTASAIGCTDEEPGPVPQCACASPCDDEPFPIDSRDHRDGSIDYPDRPPAGGEHSACWGAWGIHATELPDERWVHNLEHGAVVFLYNCPDGCPEDVAALEGLVQSRGAFAMLTPYPQMDSRFAVVAWGRRMQLDCLDLEVMGAFHDNYVDLAPESTTAPPPVSCPP